MKKLFFILIFISINSYSFSQNGFLLIISNQDAIIEIDGEAFGSVIANTPTKIELSIGDHYFQAFYENSNERLEYNTIINIDENNQTILKFKFEKLEAKIKVNNIRDTSIIASLNFYAPSFDTKLYYYAFASGDEFLVDLKLLEKRGSLRIEILQYPTNNVFTKSRIVHFND